MGVSKVKFGPGTGESGSGSPGHQQASGSDVCANVWGRGEVSAKWRKLLAIQAYLVLLPFASQVLSFLQSEGKMVHQPKDYYSLFLQYLLYYGGLKPNLHYFLGMPVITDPVIPKKEERKT